MSHARSIETSNAGGDRSDEEHRSRRHTWLWPLAFGALLSTLGWIALRLLENDRELAVHAARLGQLERTIHSIDSKLDRLIERR